MLDVSAPTVHSTIGKSAESTASIWQPELTAETIARQTQDCVTTCREYRRFVIRVVRPHSAEEPMRGLWCLGLTLHEAS